ncbi:hypothetical protein WG66_016097 [Moniliophthora roreri]|nr:hypothetical protein WG66_016097 [Moniliophthora roreri]
MYKGNVTKLPFTPLLSQLLVGTMPSTDASGGICDVFPETKKTGTTNSSSSVQIDIASDDGYTITAYGDISQSEIYFVPSAPSEIHPTPNGKPGTYRRNARRPLPPQLKKNVLLRTQDKNHEDGSIARQAQKAAMSQPELDFNTLVATLHGRPDKVSPAMPYLKSIEVRASPPRATRESTVERGPEAFVAESGLAKPISPPSKLANSSARPDKKANTPSPKSPISPKPLRTGPLPRRPPLPRWEPTDPDVVPSTARFQSLGTMYV